MERAYFIDFEEILKKLKQVKAKRIFLQSPEGLKKRVLELASFLEENGYDVVIDTEPCFGSCDLPVDRARHAACDTILHLGHVSFGLDVEASDICVVYHPVRSNIDVLDILESEEKKWKDYDSFALGVTSQHLHQVDDIIRFMKSRGKNVLIGRNRRNGINSVIFGCDYSAVLQYVMKAEAILLVAGGMFHARGMMKTFGRDVVHVDVDAGRVRVINSGERRMLIKREMLTVEKFLEARRVGVIFSSKPGQMQADPYRVKSIVEREGKQAFLLAADIISRDKLEGLDLDFLINLACPRIEEDKVFSKPVLGWNTLVKYLKIRDTH